MTNELARAISIANHYFMLADGMIPGFKDHLAKHVELEWFGKKITGKKTVAAFIMSHKMESFHKFDDIKSISDFTANEKQSNRSRKSSDQIANNKRKTHTCNSREELTRYSHETEMSMNYENAIDFNQEDNENDATSVHKNDYDTFDIVKNKLKMMTVCDDANVNTDVDANTDANQNEISAKAIVKMNDKSYDLNKNDLCNLFEPEITSEAIVEKIQNINRTELKEEMAPTVRAINRECGQGDGPVIVEAGTTKYLEANGTIQFSQLNIQDTLFLKHYTNGWSRKNWKRKCRLQIAYSLLKGNISSKIDENCTRENVRSASHSSAHETQKNKLSTLEEAIQVSNALIKDPENFGGYLQPLNCSDYCNKRLSNLKDDMQKKYNETAYVRYDKNKLHFVSSNKKPVLKIMYKIHKIVYTEVEQNA